MKKDKSDGLSDYSKTNQLLPDQTQNQIVFQQNQEENSQQITDKNQHHDEKSNIQMISQEKNLENIRSLPEQAINGNASDGNQDKIQPLDETPQPFSSVNVRQNFVRKVYLILTTQILVTFLMILLPIFITEYQTFQVENYWISIVTLVISVSLLYILGCVKSVARNVPYNYILLTIFTLCEAYSMLFK